MPLKLIGVAIIFAFLWSHTAVAQDCSNGEAGTTIFFVNGVNTVREKAERAIIQSLAPLVNNRIESTENPDQFGCRGFKLAYNHNEKWLLDFVEAGIQLLEGQATLFWRLLARLDPLPESFETFAAEQVRSLDLTTYLIDRDLQEHVQMYAEELRSAKRIVAIAHSQGNLYANAAYRQLTMLSAQGAVPPDSYSIVAVATPASFVEGNGPYVTRAGDIIELVPAALRPNTPSESCGLPWSCHYFFESYLGKPISTDRILTHVLDAILRRPEVQVSPSVLDFGDVALGSSRLKRVTVQNTGRAILRISDMHLSSGDFSLQPVAVPVDLVPDESTNASITFSPTGVGLHLATLGIHTNAFLGRTEVPISGVGASPPPSPDISVSPSELDFGSVQIGSSARATFTITNTGNAHLTVSGISLSGSTDFTLNTSSFPPPPFNVDPGASQTFDVTFAPTTEGLAQGTITITSNAPTSPSVVGLSGAGLAQSQSDRAWIQKFPPNAPTSRFFHVMSYDNSRNQAVLFGGGSGGLFDGFSLLAETWIWDGTTWRQETPSVSPPGRILHALSYDSARQETVLFGGMPAPQFFSQEIIRYGDTWIWNGSDWQQRFPASNPTPRSDFGMAYDRERAETILFGGIEEGFCCNHKGDTWIWNGTDWVEKFPSTSPGPRQNHQMAYDALRKQVVLFGGFLASAGQFVNETWIWDGSNWIQRFPSVSPPPLAHFAMTFDESLGLVILFGGFNLTSGLLSDDTWAWDGSNWTLLSFSEKPAGRRYFGVTYDAANRETVLYGGNVFSAPGGFLQDTWVLPSAHLAGADAWTTRASTPTERHLHTSSVSAGNIYVMGGDGFVGRVDMYDASMNTWTPKAPMPTPRAILTSAEVKGKIYVFGGDTASGQINSRSDIVEEYDPISDVWSAKMPMPTRRSWAAAAALNGRIYVIGGADEFATSLATVEVYDPSADSWSLAAPLNVARAGLTASSVNGRIYAIGGASGFRDLGTVEEYDPVTNTWALKNSMPTPRSQICSAVVNATIFVIGGGNTSGFLGVNEEYDPATDTWVPRAPMPTPRQGLTCSAINRRVFAIGGANSAGSVAANEAYSVP